MSDAPISFIGVIFGSFPADYWLPPVAGLACACAGCWFSSAISLAADLGVATAVVRISRLLSLLP
jgi:hypothetical protein